MTQHTRYSMNTITTATPHDPFATKETTHAFFQRLEKLRYDCGPRTSKHDQARVLIAACIDEGIVSRRRLIGILAQLKFDRRHAGKTLHEFCGPDPDRHDWWSDEAGNYRLHPDPAHEAASNILI